MMPAQKSSGGSPQRLNIPPIFLLIMLFPTSPPSDSHRFPSLMLCAETTGAPLLLSLLLVPGERENLCSCMMRKKRRWSL